MVCGIRQFKIDTIVCVTSEQAFGQILKEERKAKNFSQEKLSDLTGLHTATISFYERGIKGPTIDSILKLSRALGVPANELIGKVEALHPESR